jgi:hypothetical protein
VSDVLQRQAPADAAVLAQAIRESLQPLVDEVRQLREIVAAALDPDAPPPVVACQHPPDCRLNFGGMGEDDVLICSPAKGGCGYQHGRQE